jgi:hypothetical protein
MEFFVISKEWIRDYILQIDHFLDLPGQIAKYEKYYFKTAFVNLTKNN